MGRASRLLLVAAIATVALSVSPSPAAPSPVAAGSPPATTAQPAVEQPSRRRAPTAPKLAGPVAAPDSYRGRAEVWVRQRAYPALLGRPGSLTDATFWAVHVIHSSPGGIAALVARSTEARRRQVDLAYETGLGRAASIGDRRFWGGRLASAWSHDRLVAHLLASGETLIKHGAGTGWVSWVYRQLLGRTGSAGEVAGWGDRLRRGDPHHWIARLVSATGEARARTVRLVFQEVRGRAPTANELSAGTASLRASSGDPMRLRAEVVTPLAPRGYRIGVVGDSVAWDLEFRSRGQFLPGVVTGGGRPVPGARIACGVLATMPGYHWGSPMLIHPPTAPWGSPGDGNCSEVVVPHEGAMLDQHPQVVVWPIGAWEWTPVRRPDGVILEARSPETREELAAEIVRRIDRWSARGVRRVLLPEWACVGLASFPGLRDPRFAAFVRTVLDEVVARRPAQAAVAATPPEVCAGGDPAASPTGAHRVARGDAYHWVSGPHGAAWGWTWWLAPAVADLTGVR